MLTEETNDKLKETHDYPFYKEIQIEEMNLLPEEVEKLAGIWIKLKEYALKRLAGGLDAI